jgi:predicted transcriptional regulator
MSLLMDLLFKVPLTLSVEIFKKLMEEIEREALLTEESVKQRLQACQLLLEEGKLSEEEYDKLERELIERLHKIRRESDSVREVK